MNFNDFFSRSTNINQLTAFDFLEIILERIQSHGHVTYEHDYDLCTEAMACLSHPHQQVSSHFNEEENPDFEEFVDDNTSTLPSVIKRNFDNLSQVEQQDLLVNLLTENSQPIVEIPLEMVKNCYLKEMGESCQEEMAMKIARQVARDIDFHRSIHLQVIEACRSASDENMMALLSI